MVPDQNTLETPIFLGIPNEGFGSIKISKLTTMRGEVSPTTLISKQAKEQTHKRLTIISPMNQFGRNASSLSRRIPRGNSRLRENTLNSQASRLEDRISRLNGPGDDHKK